MKSKLLTKKNSLNSSEKYALWFIAVLTLIVTPGLTYDPINVPKFLILGLGTSVLSILLLKNNEIKFLTKQKVLIGLSLSFIATLVLSSVVSKSNVSSVIFGSPGRHTGLISYVSLAIVLVLFSTISTLNFASSVHRLILHLCFGLSLYGLLQYVGLEIFPYGSAYGSSVFGTFGNSNFLSAFLGMGSVASGLTAMNSNLNRKFRIFGLVAFVSAIFTIFLSDSQQGFLVSAAGLGVGIIINLYRYRKYAFVGLASFLYFVAGFFASLGFFNIGPAASLIYQSSLGIRKEYWSAAIQMMKEYTAFGVGLDNFGDFYRRSRSVDFARFNPGIVTDSAHNVFLDLGSGGGIFVLFTYSVIILYTFVKAYKIIRQNNPSDFVYVVLFSTWLAYIVQSFISINNLGLAIWGWALSGLLIGYQPDEIQTPPDILKNKISIHSKIVISLAIIIGLFTVPTFVSSTYFYSALKSGNAITIKNSAFIFPDDLSRYVLVAKALQSNNFQVEAKEVLDIGVRKFPDSFDLWKLYSESAVASQSQKMKARSEMQRLDPNNPDLK